MNKPLIGLKEKSQPEKKIHPKMCPKCGSENILGWGTIIGSGWINLSDMSVDECADVEDFEIYDEDNLEYICQEKDCGYEWE